MVQGKTVILSFVLLLYNNGSSCKKYDNYTLFRGIPTNIEQLNFLRSMSDNYETDFWRHPGAVNKPVEFLISPYDKELFLRDANQTGLYLTTIITDVQRAFDLQLVKHYVRRKMDSFNWHSFYKLDDIYNWLRDLCKLYPNEMTVQSIGKTYEDRDILAVGIMLKGCKNRSTVMIEGGIHSREWISPMFVTYMINKIIHAPEGDDKKLKEIATTYHWYFVPVLNPDGYEYTHTQDRMWRKNRHGNHGVDLNRNFAFAFGREGVSYKQTSEIYCGPSPFSERETAAYSHFVQTIGESLEYYIAFHAYGQFMIIPYAHLTKHHGNYDEVKKMSEEAAAQIRKNYGTEYTIGTAFDTVGYLSSGVSGCWAKASFSVPYVVTLELRDKGREGFALSPQNILPTCTETMDGMISFLTPRKRRYSKIKEPLNIGGNGSKFSESIILIFNYFIFIILRF